MDTYLEIARELREILGLMDDNRPIAARDRLLKLTNVLVDKSLTHCADEVENAALILAKPASPGVH